MQIAGDFPGLAGPDRRSGDHQGKQPGMLTAKARYPWKVGAPSFVIPADLTANVSLLASRVDAVQLLFFESASGAALENIFDGERLRDIAREHDLVYTVHLPADIFLGDAAEAVRRQGVAEICRLVEKLSALSPCSYDLHLNFPAGQDQAAWLESVDAALAELAVRLGTAKELVAVENINYPYALVQPLVARHGLARCLDFGHVQRFGHDMAEALDAVKNARHIHFHGVVNGRDHEALLPEAQEDAVLLGETLDGAEFSGVVTLEVYSLEKLETSLRTLEIGWQKFTRSSL